MNKLAFLSPFLPYPPDTGGKIRTFYIIAELAKHYDMHVLTVYGDPSPEHIKQFEEIGVKARHFQVPLSGSPLKALWRRLSPVPEHVSTFVNASTIQQVREYLAAEKFDVIFADEIVMTPYLDKSSDIVRGIVLHNIDYNLRKQMFQQEGWNKRKLALIYEYVRLYFFSRRVYRLGWDCVLTCSDSDEQVYRRLNPGSSGVETIVMANGVDVDRYVLPPPLLESYPPTLIFIGSMFYHPNIDAMLWFFEEIYDHIRQQIPDICVYIVGHNPAPQLLELEERFSQVFVTGSVKDVRPYMARSHVIIVPLRLGSGTSLKIMEGLAAGKPIVTTSVGARGLDLEIGHDLLVGDEPEVFAGHVVNLIKDDDLYQQMVENGRKASARYDWKALTAEMYEVYQEITAGRERGR